jgi:phosphoribosyl-AMP cyclohydrolase
MLIDWHVHINDPKYMGPKWWKHPVPMTVEHALDAHSLVGLDRTVISNAVHYIRFCETPKEALAQTLETGIGHFWSRARGRPWKKGEESGNLLRVSEVRTDCDQDVVWLKVTVEGAGVACHTGERSCFYRSLPLGAPPDPDHPMRRA